MTLTVDGNTHQVTNFLDFAAGQTKRPEIPKNKMVVGSTGLKLIPIGNEGLSKSPGVGNDLFSVRLPLGSRDLMECGSDGGNSLQCIK